MVIQEIQLYNNGEPTGTDIFMVPEVGEIVKYQHIPKSDGTADVVELMTELSPDGLCSGCFFEKLCGPECLNESPIICHGSQRFDNRCVIFKNIVEYTTRPNNIEY